MRKTKGAAARTRPIDSGRRQALIWAGGALLAAAGAAVAVRRAGAITLVEADAETQAAFHQACGPVAYHQQLLEDLQRKLLSTGQLDRTPDRDIGCPVCGCRLRLAPPKDAAR
ncbi:MAG: hypothetical protein KF889_17225 [Alphaproteobacteria bacterium]|nr:hypothetical protein [Alphaproteobacteria bacterium]MCW5739888.1 hypothetical protein [Alphaproteobacteria bacterium]